MYNKNPIMNMAMNIVQHYNHKSYWRMRDYVVNSGGVRILKYIYLFRIKRMDAYNCASLGTHIGFGAQFKDVPYFPHGIRGIFVSDKAVIGKNAIIFHHVTIGRGSGGSPTIGDNVYIGAGAKIVGKIYIGDNVKIGAGCVISKDIPDNCTVVMEKPRIICRG